MANFLPGTNPEWGRKLPDGDLNSLVDAAGNNYDNGYNFDEKEDDISMMTEKKIADAAIKAYEDEEEADGGYSLDSTDPTTQPIENSNTDSGINTEKEIQRKETLIVYTPTYRPEQPMSFDEEVSRLLELGFSIDSEYAGEETGISYFDRGGAAAYSSEPFHKMYLVKGKLAVRIKDLYAKNIDKIDKPSKKYKYLEGEVCPHIDLSDVEKVNTLVSSSESVEGIADKLWDNKEVLSDKHSLIDLSKYVSKEADIKANSRYMSQVYQAHAILKTLLSEHKEALESGEVMIACRDYDWSSRDEKKYCYVVSMEKPKGLWTVDSGKIYQFKDDFYEDTYGLYQKYCEDKGLIPPDAQYTKKSGFVRLEDSNVDSSLSGYDIEARKEDIEAQKMDYFQCKSYGRWPILLREEYSSHIAIYQPTLDDFKDIVKKIDKISDSRTLEEPHYEK